MKNETTELNSMRTKLNLMREGLKQLNSLVFDTDNSYRASRTQTRTEVAESILKSVKSKVYNNGELSVCENLNQGNLFVRPFVRVKRSWQPKAVWVEPSGNSHEKCVMVVPKQEPGWETRYELDAYWVFSDMPDCPVEKVKMLAFSRPIDGQNEAQYPNALPRREIDHNGGKVSTSKASPAGLAYLINSGILAPGDHGSVWLMEHRTYGLVGFSIHADSVGAAQKFVSAVMSMEILNQGGIE